MIVPCHHCGKEAAVRLDKQVSHIMAYRVDAAGPICGKCERKKDTWIGKVVFKEANGV